MSVLIIPIGCGVECSKQLINQLIEGNHSMSKSDKFESDFTVCEDNSSIVCRAWKLKTKYYSAQLMFYIANLNDAAAYRPSSDAVIYHFGSENDVDLSVCDSLFGKSFANDDEDDEDCLHICVCRQKWAELEKWCENSTRFLDADGSVRLLDLVELDPSAETKEELEEYYEKWGVERVLQLLSAHSWSEMELLEDQNFPITYLTTDALKETANQNDTNSCATTSSNSGALHGENEPNSANKLQDDADSNAAETFESLFARFAEMKSHAASLQGDDRKEFAAEIAMAFYKAMGGDDDEIHFSSSDDEKEGEAVDSKP